MSIEHRLNAMLQAPMDRKQATAVIAAGVYASRSVPDVLASCEALRPPDRKILIIDWQPNSCAPEDMYQDVYFTNADLLAHVTMNTVIPSQIRGVFEGAYGLLGPVRDTGREARELVTDRVGLLKPLEDQLEKWQGHGKLVAGVIRNVARSQGTDVRPVLYPIQKLYESVRRDEDELGNPILFAKMNTDWFIDAIDQNPEAEIVNFSWQINEVGIKTVLHPKEEEGNALIHIPGTEILGAFREEVAYENMQVWERICEAKPEVDFNIAAGNFREDLRNVKERPDNLLIIGEYSDKLNALGADIYVSTRNRVYNPDGSHGSTVASSTVTGFKVKLLGHGLNREEINAEVMKRTRRVVHPELVALGEEDPTLLVFDPGYSDFQMAA